MVCLGILNIFNNKSIIFLKFGTQNKSILHTNDEQIHSVLWNKGNIYIEIWNKKVDSFKVSKKEL